MAYDNTNKGALWKNEDKDASHPNWADYQGSINVGGVDYWISAWIKTGKENTKVAGKKFMSLEVKPKEARQEAPKSGPAAGGTKGSFADMDDDIPFSPYAKGISGYSL